MAEPSLVLAKLDDDKLKDSINSLVNHLENSLERMKKSTTNAVRDMQQTLQSLGNIKVDTGGSADGGSSKRAKKQREETQAVNDTIAAYDKLAEAQQKAYRKKGIEYMSLPSDVQEGLTYLVNVNKDVDSQLDSIIQKERAMIAEREKEAQLAREIAEQQSRIAVAPNGYAIGNSRETNKSVGVDLQRLKEATVGTEEFTQAIARLTNKQEYEINLANADTDSYNRLAKTLKDLQTAYNNMTAAERKSENGLSIRASIIEVEQAINRIKREASRPVSLDSILKIDPKTLDEVVEKMRLLQSYRGGIDITKPTAKKELSDINQELDRLQKKQREIIGQDKSMIEINNALSRSWNYMKNRLAFYFTVGASTQFVKGLIDIRGQYEMLERSIGILFDSMQTGSHIFAELNAMAIKSPFTTMELGAAAKQLSAYNIAAKDVVDTTRRLADIAAAVGIPIERLTYALGQIKSYGYLNSRDARMFANAGIPLIQNLADMYTKLEGRLVSIGDVYDRIKKKQISFEDTVKVINEMTDEGGRFFNFQEKSAETLKVKLANLNLAYNNFLNELGKRQQGMLVSGLGAFKVLLENWKSFSNALSAVAVGFGLVKVCQIVYLRLNKGIATSNAIATATTEKFATRLMALKASFMSLVTSQTFWLTTLATALIFLKLRYNDIQESNERFNKSLSDNAKETISSVDKFIKDYGDDIAKVGSMKETDQTKLWERIRDEIEKTSKNAREYIEILEKIPDVSNRITRASSFFDQQKIINEEVSRLSERGYFNTEGGFANSELAKALDDYETALNKIIREYGSLDEARKKDAEKLSKLSDRLKENYISITSTFEASSVYAKSLLDNFTKILEKADLNRVMGQGTQEEMFANIREYASIIRDNFLATEEGQKVTAQGQLILNSALDEWIAKKGYSNGLISKEVFEIEQNRSAWEKFFTYLGRKQKERLDLLLNMKKAGRDVTSELNKIWKDVIDNVKEKDAEAFAQIQDHIQVLKDTPDVIINVIYREKKENLDEQQKAFEKRWITPEYNNVLSPEALKQEEDANRMKYGRLMRKQDEDNVEWETRLGEEYQKNLKTLESLNAQLAKGKKISDADRDAKIKERDALIEANKALKDVGDSQGFNYDKFAKGGKNKKDVLGDAFKDEVEIIQNIQKRYKEYRKEGVSAQDAISKATDEYGKTLVRVNSTLNKYGVKTKKSDELANMDMRSLRSYYTSLLNMASSLGNAKGVEALEKAIAGLNVEITKVDYKTILDGLNSQLGKLKEDYELSVELDANPELGTMFTDLFKIDTNTLPKDIYDYIEKIQGAVDDAIKASDKKLSTFDILGIDADKWAKDSGVEIGSDLYKNIEAAQKQARSAMKRYVTDVSKQTKDLQYKLADTNGKIAIEEKKLAELQKQLANETHEEKKRLLELEIQEQQEAISKLKEELLQLLPTYKALFGGIVEHSAYMTRRLGKQMQEMLNNAVKNPDGTYTVTDPRSGQQATMGGTAYANLVKKTNEELRKSATPMQKLKEAFSKGEDDVVDYWKGVELVCEELQKLSSLVSEIGNFAQAVGFDENTVDTINTVATSIGGVATAGEGLAKIAAGDYIGGAASVISGVTSIISAWSDNYDKKINREIKESELRIKKLELAYVDLQHAIDKAYGTSVIGAKTAAAAEKKLELQELERQLRLEKARDSKHRDDDRIVELQKQIKELKYEIQDAYKEIVNDLMGTDVGSFAENLVSAMVDAFKQGEDAMKVFNDKFDELIDNMIMKSLMSRIVSSYIDKLWEEQEAKIKARSKNEADDLANARNKYEEYSNMSFKDWLEKTYGSRVWTYAMRAFREQGIDISYDELYKRLQDMYEHRLEAIEKEVEAANNSYEDATDWTNKDIKDFISSVSDIRDDLYKELYDGISQWYTFGQGSEKSLSALQQGIQGITEDTAGAIEAYLNGVSQQVYLHSDLLTQIRDTVVSFDFDVQLGVMSQMLMHLQNSYQTQQSIQRILENVLTPSGRAFAVEIN